MGTDVSSLDVLKQVFGFGLGLGIELEMIKSFYQGIKLREMKCRRVKCRTHPILCTNYAVEN